MKTEEVIARLDWAGIGLQLNQEGYAILPGFLSESQVRDLAALRDSTSIDRRVSLASEDIGRGDQFYFSVALPPLIADLRTWFYKHLSPVANRWNETLGVSHCYPGR